MGPLSAMRCRRPKRLIRIVAVMLAVIPIAPAWAQAIGSTPGTAGASASGGAVYAVPLWAPEGTGGLSPNLALVYSSQSGNGNFGMGWNLSGLSTISRCPKTWAQDGAPRNVRNDWDDAYCLDGSRLRLTMGMYGHSGARYQTEIERFVSVASWGVAGNGPAYFVVTGADGRYYEYGATEDSRIQSVGQSTVRVWALNRVYDRSGNELLYSYEEDTTNGDFRLSSIRWTRNAAAGLAADYSMNVAYETIPLGEVDVAYDGGSVIRRVTRATGFEVTHAGSVVRRYALTYQPGVSNAGRSRLASLQECVPSPASCLSPTTFTYQDGVVGVGGESNTGVPIPATPLVLDLNGDGRDDLAYSSSATSGGGTWTVMFATAAGTYGAPVSTGISNTNFHQAFAIDYNADGFQDVMVPYAGGTWWVMLGGPGGLGAPADVGTPVTTPPLGFRARAMDIDGDGYQDLVWFDRVGRGGGDAIRYRLRTPATGGFSGTVVDLAGPMPSGHSISNPSVWYGLNRAGSRNPDFNGDGRDDLSYWYTTCTRGECPQYTVIVRPGLPDVQLEYLQRVDLLGDFNGDGRTDFAGWGTNTIYVYFSTGSGFTNFVPVPATGVDQFETLDWDGDGFDDILGRDSATGQYSVFRSLGETFAAPVGTSVWATELVIGTPDLNGDGLRDLAYSSGGTWRTRLRSGGMPDLLTAATNGFGITARFSYAPLSDASLYTRGAGAPFPMQDFTPTAWAVRSLQQTDGTGTGAIRTQTYSYAGARRHLQGRGFLGFASRTTVDDTAGYNTRTVESFRQDFPFSGAPASVERIQANGRRVSLATITWDQLTFGGGPTARVHPYARSIATDQHELGGAGLRVVSSTTTYAGIDGSSGVPTDVTTEIREHATGLNPGALLRERVQHSLAASSSWCHGRPETTTVTREHSLAFGEPITRTQRVLWDDARCRPERATIEPGHPSLEQVVTLGYDAFGNLNLRTVGGPNVAARRTAVQFGSRGQFPEAVTNALDETTRQTWNYALGVPTAVVDANGLETRWNYDAYGRRTYEIRPDQTRTDWALFPCDGCEGRGRYQVRIQQQNASGGVFNTRWQQLDAFHRLVVDLQQQAGGGFSRVLVEYDARGREFRRHVPHWSGLGSSGWWETRYDLLDRPVSSALYGSGGVLDREIQTTYEGLVTAVRDARGHVTRRHFTAWGDLQRVADASGGSTLHDHDAFGQLRRVTDAAGVVSTAINYNVRGMRTFLQDVNSGAWSFVPNTFGEVVSQVDAKGQPTSFAYDALGRLTQRIEAEGTSTWTWGSAAHNGTGRYIGALKRVDGPGFAEEYINDAVGRVQWRRITSDTLYEIGYGYNELGRLATVTYPASTGPHPFQVRYAYQHGHLTSVQETTGGTLGTVLWSQTATDALGNPVDETFGQTSLRVISGYSPLTGMIEYRQAGTGGSTANRQNLAFAWDVAGNLRERADVARGLTESFVYDPLNRLDASTLNGAPHFDVALSPSGNILQMRDGPTTVPANTYAYAGGRPHAVSSTTGPVNVNGTVQVATTEYAYDPNGNLTSKSNAAGTTTVEWTSYNLPRIVRFTPVTTGGGGGGGAPPTNVAIGKPTRSEGAPCATNEGPEKAVNGSVGGGWSDKWCSLNSGRWLEIDLGTAHALSRVAIQHAQAGGESPSWNTRDFTIQVGDGNSWSTPVSVSGNTQGTTDHPLTGVTGRYVRLNVITPTSDGNPATRIYEVEVWGSLPTAGGAPGTTNLALNRPASSEGAACAANEGAEKAFNGSVGGGNPDKWCSLNATKWLQVDLGSNQALGQFVIKHAETGGEASVWNTRDFNIQVSADGSTWTTAVTVTGNTAGTTTHPVSGTTARYVRLNVVTPTTSGDPAARIYEFEVYGTAGIPAPEPLTAQFFYAPERQYVRQVARYANGVSTTEYVGGLLEKVSDPGGVFYRHLVEVGTGFAIVTRGPNGTQYYYATRDHLGSTALITDASGAPLIAQSFNAYGERRTEGWQPGVPNWDAIAVTTRRGYTGHTMLDNLNLIHMNGRMFDPDLGRFISADPIADGLGEAGGFNRYAYVRGNPLSAFDPWGWKEFKICVERGPCTVAEDPSGAGGNVTFGNMPDYTVSAERAPRNNPFQDWLRNLQRSEGREGNTGAGGESSGGGGDSDNPTDSPSGNARTETPQQCRNRLEKWVQAGAGLTGGGVSGALVGGFGGFLAGSVAGGATGFVTGSLSGAGAPGWFAGGVGAPTAAVTTAFAAQAFTSGGATASGMLFAAYGGLAGGAIPGAAGAAAGAGISGIPGILSLAKAGAVGGAGAFAALSAYLALDTLANRFCGQ